MKLKRFLFNNIKKLENNKDKENDIGKLIIETTGSFILEVQKNQYNYKNVEDIKRITDIIVMENKIFKDIKYAKKKPILHISTDYPIYPYDQNDPEGFYSNIYNYIFLKNKNISNSIYPNYINEAKENVETKKRGFRKKAKKYIIDKDGYLCYKKYYKINILLQMNQKIQITNI